MKTFLRTAGLATLLAFSATPLLAAQASVNFNVTLTINAECKIISASNINFGTITFLSSNIDMDGTIIVQCTNSTPYNIGLGAGNGSGATVASRVLTAPGPPVTTVAYSLYSDVARTAVWGNVIGTNTVTGTGTGANQSYTVHGRVAPQVLAAPGAYTDVIQVTVTY